MRGGDALIHALEKEGVEYISGFAGGGEVPLWPALRASQSIKVFSSRHERMGVEIADGYARATGKVGVALTGTGPGATNTLTGIAGAYADNIPVLLLMGQHPLGSMGREIQQEVPSSIFDSFVKWKGTFSRIEDIPATVRRAFTNLRSGSPGPVVLEMPMFSQTVWSVKRFSIEASMSAKVGFHSSKKARTSACASAMLSLPER